MNTQEDQNTEKETFLGISQVSLHGFLRLSFDYFSKLFHGLLLSMNTVNSKNSQISMSLIDFQGKILIFMEF